jgi:hypothetical protein
VGKREGIGRQARCQKCFSVSSVENFQPRAPPRAVDAALRYAAQLESTLPLLTLAVELGPRCVVG